MAFTCKLLLATISVAALGLSLAAQDPLRTVHLTVRHNGKEASVPEKVSLTIGGRTTNEPVRNGQFQVPSEVFASAGNVTFSFVIGKDQIRLTLLATNFRAELWNLILEDHHFGNEYSLPPGTNPRAACVLVVGSKTGDPIELVSAHCRTKLK